MTAIVPGARVKVAPGPDRLNKDLRDRVGTVERLNEFSRDISTGTLCRGGLWRVALDPRGRAKARVTLFWGDELVPSYAVRPAT